MTSNATSTVPFNFTKKFAGHGPFELVLTPVAGGDAIRATRTLSIKSTNLSKTTLGKPAGQLSMDGVDVNYNLVAGGWKGEKTYYLYVMKNERSCFFPLAGVEYHSFKASKATLTAVKVKAETPEGPAIEVTEQPPVQEPTEVVVPTKAGRRAQRGQKTPA